MKTKSTLYALLYFAAFALCAFSLAHCKADNNQPLLEKHWRLSFEADGVSVQDLQPYDIDSLIDCAAGRTFRFGAPDFALTVNRCGDGTVTSLGGTIRGDCFVMVNGLLNFCGGGQGIEFTYKLEYR